MKRNVRLVWLYALLPLALVASVFAEWYEEAVEDVVAIAPVFDKEIELQFRQQTQRRLERNAKLQAAD